MHTRIHETNNRIYDEINIILAISIMNLLDLITWIFIEI